jgi:hypothetical protein
MTSIENEMSRRGDDPSASVEIVGDIAASAFGSVFDLEPVYRSLELVDQRLKTAAT